MASRNIVVFHSSHRAASTSRFVDRHGMRRPHGTQLRSFTVLSRLFIQELRVQQLGVDEPPTYSCLLWFLVGLQSTTGFLYLSFRDTQPHPLARRPPTGSFLPLGTVTDRGRYKSGSDYARLSRLSYDLSDVPVELTVMGWATREKERETAAQKGSSPSIQSSPVVKYSRSFWSVIKIIVHQAEFRDVLYLCALQCPLYNWFKLINSI